MGATQEETNLVPPKNKSFSERVLKVFFLGIKKLIPQSLRTKIREQFSSLPAGSKEAQSLQQRVTDLETRLNDEDIFLKQLLSILQREYNFLPPPPKHLQIRVVGDYVPGFIESGFSSIYPDLNRSLEKVGKQLGDFQRILDFGCGCGRAIRALSNLLPRCQLYGIDIDQEAIEWLKSNYSELAEFSVAPHIPPTTFESQMFDLIFGISVFTHLPEEMQFQWLNELSRITKSGGYIILTTHGEKHYKSLDKVYLEIMEKKGFLYSDFGDNYGKSISLPDFYQTSFHSHAYIQREWKKYFDVINIQTLGLQNHQDIILLQKRF
jgi:ubiquinone/menaquinone biosynthesis C-methylase UbiE